MKQNFTESQYIQLAKEQFCKTLIGVPFVSEIEVLPGISNNSYGDFEAIIHFSDSIQELRFVIEVKTNGEKRFVKSFIYNVSLQSNDVHYLFMAPYISESSAQYLREQNCSYLDLSGNCYILTNRIIISMEGKPNKYLTEKNRKNYFFKSSNAASVVMRTMLNDYKKLWQVKELAMITNKALGTVSNVKSFLMDRDWIEDKPNGFKLCNIKEMLYSWAADYHKKDARTFEYYSFGSVPEIESDISEWNKKHGGNAALGCFAAAVRYAPTVRYKKVHVYVEPQDFQEFVSDLDLREVESGGNVVITIPHDETPCMFVQDINGNKITSPVQTVLDLLGNSSRGQEAADAIILKQFK